METKLIGLQSLIGIDFQTLATAYQTVYGEAPWSEYKKCSICEASFGIEKDAELKAIHYIHCGQILLDWWPNEFLFDHFSTISSKSCFSASMAYDGPKIVGFAWGYEITLDDVDNELELPGLRSALESTYFYDKKIKIGYLADLAVNSSHRGIGLAKELAKVRHEVLKKNNVDVVITRTKGGSDPSITHLWYDKIGFKILLPYNDDRKRVIRSSLVKNLNW